MHQPQKISATLILWTMLFMSSTTVAGDYPSLDYTVKSGDTVTTVLYRLGIGTPESLHRLYGKDGWVERMRVMNPGIDLSRIHPGDVIKIPNIEEPPQEPHVAVAAEETPPEEVAPPEEIPAPPPPVITPAEASEKAAEVSFFDRKSVEDEEFLKSLPPAPPAYFGLRAAKSLSADGVMSKIITYGLLAEIRGGTFEGLRLLYEITPKVTAGASPTEQHLAYNRLLIGWAFEWHAPFLFDLIHVTPRLGRYSVDVRYPTTANAPSQDLSISGATSVGLEIDLEFAKYFYVTRFWAAGDLPIEGAQKSYETTSGRAGIDIYLKGSGYQLFGRKVSASYLLFTSFEDLQISGKGDNTDNSFGMSIPVLGAGYTLNIN